MNPINTTILIPSNKFTKQQICDVTDATVISSVIIQL